MNLIHFTLQPRAPVATPYKGDTLLGHMLWQYAYRHGTDALNDSFFERVRANPPAVSDLFPHDMLPVPKLPMNYGENADAKRIKKLAHLPISDIKALQNELTPRKLIAALFKEADIQRTPLFDETAELHATIGRLTGTTAGEGGLYARSVKHYGSVKVDARGNKTVEPILLHGYIAPGVFGDEVKELLKAVGEHGYGADSSTGLGVFDVSFDNEQLYQPPQCSAWMALSRHLPDPAARPTESYYSVETHYGRLGGSFANNGNPFKKPILLCSTGSVWRGSGQGVRGAMLDRVAFREENIRHLGYTIPLHFNLVEEMNS